MKAIETALGLVEEKRKAICQASPGASKFLIHIQTHHKGMIQYRLCA